MKTSHVHKIRKMYEETADSYAEMMDKEINLPVYKDILGRLQKSIAKTSGMLIDTACGSGHMLAMFRSQYDSKRSLIGVDLSPRMVAIANNRLGKEDLVRVGDMRSLPDITSETAAAVLNFFALHHLDVEGIKSSLLEWYRVLGQGGHLVVGAWEGIGTIDYGEESDIIARRYTNNELVQLAEAAGFRVTRCVVEPVEDFPMDAIYLECIKD